MFPFVCALFRDAKCGKIQCQGGANRPVIGTNAVSIETNIPLQEGGRILCRGTHVYLGDDMPDPGLVLAGTKCGDGTVSDQMIICSVYGHFEDVVFHPCIVSPALLQDSPTCRVIFTKQH